MARRFAYLVVTLFVAGLVLLGWAPAAWAHATIVSTSPADGAIVARAPTEVSATFDEPVGVSLNSVEVFSPNGSRVDEGGAKHGSIPPEVVVELDPGLANGTYTVGWAVVSADSHHVSGAFTFSIGARSATTVNPNAVNQTGSPLVSIAFDVVRWVAFCCFALLIGAVGFVLWCWPAGASSPLVLRLTMGAWSGLASSVLAAVLLQGAYGAGEGVGHVFWPNVLHATLYSRYGRALGVRLILVIVALFIFTVLLGNLRATRRRPPVAASIIWGVLSVALAATWSFADHAGVGRQVPLSLLADTVHLSGAAVWLGGLTMLATIVLRRPNSSLSRPARNRANPMTGPATAEVVAAVERFSPIALACVGAILLTGTYQAWRNVGNWVALVDTTYGRLLLIKIAAMVLLIGLGYLARIRITSMRAPTSAVPVSIVEFATAGLPRVSASVRSGVRVPSSGAVHGDGLSDGSSSGSLKGAANGRSSGAATNGRSNVSSSESGHAAVTLSKLRWSVAAETLIVTVVLAITAVLVNTPTARETFKPPASATVAFNTGGPGGRGKVSIIVTPAILGPNQVRLSVTSSAGRSYVPEQIEASLVLPARHLGPLPVALRADGAGRYASGSITMPITGQWQLQITIRSDAFDETTVAVPVDVS